MKLLGNIPKKCYLACSGGVDSMVLLNFLLRGKREVTLLYLNHNTKHGQEAEEFLKAFSKTHNLELIVNKYNGVEQTEEAWRNARYEFFSKYTKMPILQAHNLSENIETWLLSSIKGTSKFIPYKRDNIIRPFLLVSKEEILNYAKRNKIKWIEDPSNSASDYDRNKIRNEIIPVLKEINIGLDKVFRNKCLDKYKKDGIL